MLELLVVTVDDNLFESDDAQWEAPWRSPQGAASQQSTRADSLAAACPARPVQLSDQALHWMDTAECNGVRLALASSLPARVVRTLMEAADGPAWADRFAVVATADVLGTGEGEADLYRLILHTVQLPAHCSALLAASEQHRRIAHSIGMHTIPLPPRGSAPSPELKTMAGATDLFRTGLDRRPPPRDFAAAG